MSTIQKKVDNKSTKKNQLIIKKAEPFARALFDVALETLNIEELKKNSILLDVTGLTSEAIELDSNLEFFEMYNDAIELVKTASTIQQINEFFDNPFISTTKKKRCLVEFFPNLNKKIQNLIFLLIDNSRANLIFEVLNQFVLKYWEYFKIQQFEINLGPHGTECEANFVAYQFSKILTVSSNSTQTEKPKFIPTLQINNKFIKTKSALGGFSLGFAEGTGLLDFTVGSEFNKFFDRIIIKS